MPAPFRGWVALAICLTFMTVAVSYVAFYRLRGIGTGFGIYTTFAVLAPASLMFILGLVDDARNLGPQVKFGVQIIAGLLLYYGGIRIYFFPIIAGYHELNSVISMILTVMWVLLISNAFNLIDGLDGLSAGSALFSTLVVFVVSLFSGNPFVAVMSVTLAGAILGFLRYNFNPATIFLGDSGSLFLGFMLSAVSLAGAQKSTTLVAVAIPIVSFGLPLLDTFLSVVRRFLSGQPTLHRGSRAYPSQATKAWIHAQTSGGDALWSFGSAGTCQPVTALSDGQCNGHRVDRGWDWDMVRRSTSGLSRICRTWPRRQAHRGPETDYREQPVGPSRYRRTFVRRRFRFALQHLWNRPSLPMSSIALTWHFNRPFVITPEFRSRSPVITTAAIAWNGERRKLLPAIRDGSCHCC